MDIEKEREAFEKLPAVAELIKTNNVWWSDVHGDYFCSDHELDCWIDGAWAAWQAAKAQAEIEKDAIIRKLSDQLYEQEMKASAARVLCETACELLDDYAHQDAVVILNDLEQAMKELSND